MKPGLFSLRPAPCAPRVCPAAYIAPSESQGLLAAFVDSLTDVEWPSEPGGPRRLVKWVPSALIATGLLYLLTATLVRDRSDQSEIELVMLRTPSEIEAPMPELIPEPEPLPEAVAEPEPAVIRPVAKAPEPPPPPIAQPLPKPPPPVRARPAPRPQIAAAQMPKPEPLRPEKRLRVPLRAPAPPPAQHPLRPPVAIAAAPQALDTPEPRLTRAKQSRPFRALPAPAKPAPRLDPVARSEPVLLAQAPSPRPTRASRSLAVSSSRRKVAPKPMAFSNQRPTPPTPEASREPRRRAAPSPTRKAAPRPLLVAVAPEAIHERAPAPAPVRQRPAAPRPTRKQPAARRVLLAAPASLSSAAKPRPEPTAQRVARGAAPSTARASSTGGADEKLSGVPLGSLASCVSDREETALKQALLSSVKTQKECISTAGHYRFLQTRNLNAFLMWVDPAPTRAVADRCIELAYALDCVKKHN